jgi:DNA repair photolyase
MKIRMKEAKNLIVRSNIPETDYVINPYTGCQHGCIYCYAEFMKRFTNHKSEKWGKFLDIKQFDFSKIKPHKYDDKSILLSSVTDPYLPLELKYKNTRKSLKALLGTEADITILTKSKLAERDIDLFQQFKNFKVGISISTLDEKFSDIIEPVASKPQERLELIKTLHKEGIKTYIFISPFFPEITEYRKIINTSREYTDYYMFENLNFRPHNIKRIYKVIKQNYPELVKVYKQFKKVPANWNFIEEEIRAFCTQEDLQCKIAFHHGGFS